jgi:hypothetical protein
MMSHPNAWEQFRYLDPMHDYNDIIEDLHEEYEEASDYFTRARIITLLKHAERELARTMAEYETFKNYKARTAISK